jgi:hypothetical protein
MVLWSMVLVYTASGQAQSRDLAPIVKDIGPAWQALAVSAGDDELGETARQADRLVALFKEAAVFFGEEKLTDAVEMSQTAAQGAAETAKAARAKDIEIVKRVGTGILNPPYLSSDLPRTTA